MTDRPAQYPLLFTFFDKVEGNGYLADVAIHGKLLATEEDGQWWMYGVKPGALAASGHSRAEAYMEFRRTLMQVLFDLAGDARDFYAFRESARRFFDETDPETEAEWETARELVRRGSITIEGMRREDREEPRRIDIREKQVFAAKDNVVDPYAAMAA